MEVPADLIPPGWTNDPDQLRATAAPDSWTTYIARCHGLENVKPILEQNGSGECWYIGTQGGRYYGGSPLSDNIFEITKPKTFPDILRVLEKGGIYALKIRSVKFVEWLPDEDDPDNEPS